MTTADTILSNPSKIIVRIINGPLSGCEFLLSSERTLFLVGSGSDLVVGHHMPELPTDSLFIPLETGGINFELVLDGQNAEHAIVRELDGTTNPEKSVQFNNVQEIGELKVAFRLESQPWSKEVLTYTTNTITRAKSTRWLKASFFMLFSLLIFVFLLTFGYFSWTHSQDKKMVELSAQLGNDINRFHLMLGRDGIVYVMAIDEDNSIWASRVVARSGYQAVKVTNPEQENEQANRWLTENHPSLIFYRLNFDNPLQPQLLVSSQRTQLDDDELKVLHKDLMKRLPYAERVDIKFVDDLTAVRQAESGLSSLSLPFSRNENLNGVTLVVRGPLGDGELMRIRSFIESYHHQWGRRYVKFAIELKDDLIKGHSFQYGSQGYIKVNPHHWYFLKPLS